MALSPATVTMYMAWSLAYAFGVGLSYAAFTAVVQPGASMSDAFLASSRRDSIKRATFVVCLNAGLGCLLEEALNSLVSKGPNHAASVTCNATRYKLAERTTPRQPRCSSARPSPRGKARA